MVLAEEVTAFRQQLESSLLGFVKPAAYGVGVREGDGFRFPVVNHGGIHQLPGIVLAEVLGYRSGTCTIALPAQRLRQAYERLLPVEACTAFPHPNLWAWRELLRTASPGAFVAVFIGQSTDRAADDAQCTFLSLTDNTGE
ncbi:MAG: hypothetical protein AB7O92_27685 [Acidimicrobiia bacterium]